MSGIEIPEEPRGIGSVIRVVFKDPGACDAETFYVGTDPGLWVEYGSDGVGEFTWRQMLEIISFDEAGVFEVVYDGFGSMEKYYEAQRRVNDLFWRRVL